jgi:hypothetical protein
MIGIIRKEYVTVCSVDIDTKSLESICEDIATSIRTEEQLKELGIIIDDYTW